VPKIVLHALLLLGPPALVWVAQDLVPVLQTDNPHLAQLVLGVVTMLTMIFTPVVKDYGVGQAKPVGPADDPGA
jgi:hypothetical protein